MEEIYYIVEGGTSKGPYSIEGLRLLGITKDTFVWRRGMTDWQRAGEITELEAVFSPADSAFGDYARQDPSMQRNTPNNGGEQQPPQFPPYGQQQPPYGQQAPYGEQPPYGQQAPYGQQPQYGSYVKRQTNWLPWAIVGTIFGFSCSCLGGIFGIIGISKATKANREYAAGNDYIGDQENNSAQTWTILSLVLSGVGILSWVSYILLEIL